MSERHCSDCVHQTRYFVIENIAILATIALICWAIQSGWPLVLALFFNTKYPRCK
jgi:hypothetical protein